MMIKEACWGIDVGKNSIKAVCIRRDKNRLEIKAVDRVEYGRENEGQPSGEDFISALRTLVTRNKIRSTDSIAVALPYHMSLIRFIKVPQLATAELEGSIIGEARQQIPFPLEDVIWDYQKIERDYEEGEEIEVGIFAIKKEIIATFLRDFDELGLEVDVVSIAPLAIFNFVKFELDVPDNAVVLDIGADHSDLVIIEGNKFYVRELGFGGNEVTKNLQDTFSITWDDAENLKRKTNQSSQAAKIFQLIQPMLQNFNHEVQRSIGFYKSQSPGASFQALVLLGDASKLIGMPKYIGKQLGMKVHYFMDIERLGIDKELNIDILQEHLATFGISLGLALQGLGLTAHSINLIPHERRGQKDLTRKLPVLLVSAAILFLMFLFMWMDASSHASSVEELLASSKKNLDVLIEDNVAQQQITGDRMERPNANSIKGREMELEVLTSLFDNRSNALKSMNGIMNVLGMKSVAGRNYTMPEQLEGKPMSEIQRRVADWRGLLAENNKNKVWILGYDCCVNRAENGSEILVHNIEAAVPWEKNTHESLLLAERRLESHLKETFKFGDGDDVGIQPGPIPVATLEPRAKKVEDELDAKFFRFTVRWTEFVRPHRTVGLPLSESGG